MEVGTVVGMQTVSVAIAAEAAVDVSKAVVFCARRG
jgi:hypothetical protein